MLPVLFFVGLLAGVTWGNNFVCLSYHQDKTLTKQDDGKHYILTSKYSELIAHLSNGEEIYAIASIPGENFNEKAVEWLRIIYIGLIVTFMEGILFLLHCF